MKDSIKGRNAFYAVFLHFKKSNRTFVISIISCYNIGAKEVDRMQKQKYYIAVDEYERRIIINSLNNLRNKLIAEGRYTDAVDELIIKFAHAPIKKFRIKMTEV